MTQLYDAIVTFQQGAYDIQLVERLSVQLRAHLLAANITYSGVFVPTWKRMHNGWMPRICVRLLIVLI